MDVTLAVHTNMEVEDGAGGKIIVCRIGQD